MTTPDEPTLDDVMDTEESAPHDRSQHAKGYDRPDDDLLQHRTEQEPQEHFIHRYPPIASMVLYNKSLISFKPICAEKAESGLASPSMLQSTR